MKQIVIRSFLRALEPTPESQVMAALGGDGFTYADVWRIALRAEFRLVDIGLQARLRDGFRVAALSSGDGINPQTHIVLRRTSRAWILEASEQPMAILEQRRQVRFIASPFYDNQERRVRKWGFLLSHEEPDMTPRTRRSTRPVDVVKEDDPDDAAAWREFTL